MWNWDTGASNKGWVRARAFSVIVNLRELSFNFIWSSNVQPPPVLQHEVLLHEPPVGQVAAPQDAGVAPGEPEHGRRGLGDEAAVLADQQGAVPASVLATAASKHLGQLGAQGEAGVSRMSP